MHREEYEVTRATIPECFVYKVPPRARAEGYKAADWNLNESIWSGKAVVKSKGSVCIVRLEGNDGALFAQCQWDQTQGIPAVEKVLDSSRYFVLRIEHQGRHAFVGLGFNERNNAFDFNVALTDHKRDLEREVEVAKLKQAASSEPQIDFSFKEGEKITINVQARTADGQEAKRSGRRAAAAQPGNASSGGMLPPPPSAKTSISAKRGSGNVVPASQFQQQTQQNAFGGAAFPPPPINNNNFGAPMQQPNNNNMMFAAAPFQQQQQQQQQQQPFFPPQQQQQQQQQQHSNNWFA